MSQSTRYEPGFFLRRSRLWLVVLLLPFLGFFRTCNREPPHPWQGHWSARVRPYQLDLHLGLHGKFQLVRQLWRPDSPKTLIIAGDWWRESEDLHLRVLGQNDRAQAELPYDLVFLVETTQPEPSYVGHEPGPEYRFTYRNSHGIEPTYVELKRGGMPSITEEER